MKFSIRDFCSCCDQIRSFLQIWPHLLKKSIMENSFFVQWQFISCNWSLSIHCVRSVCILSFSGRYFLAFGLNTDEKNSKYGQFSGSGTTLKNIRKSLIFQIHRNNSVEDMSSSEVCKEKVVVSNMCLKLILIKWFGSKMSHIFVIYLITLNMFNDGSEIFYSLKQLLEMNDLWIRDLL